MVLESEFHFRFLKENRSPVWPLSQLNRSSITNGPSPSPFLLSTCSPRELWAPMRWRLGDNDTRLSRIAWKMNSTWDGTCRWILRYLYPPPVLHLSRRNEKAGDFLIQCWDLRSGNLRDSNSVHESLRLHIFHTILHLMYIIILYIYIYTNLHDCVLWWSLPNLTANHPVW